MSTYKKKTLTSININFYIKGDLYDPSLLLPPPHLTASRAAGSLSAGRKETDGRRKEWDGRCSNSFTDNDEAIDMAAGDTTPKLIRHTLYTHSTSLQDIFSLRYTYVLEVYSEVTTYFKPFTGTVIKCKL